MKNTFRKVANRVSAIAGSPYTFLLAIIIVITWALSGSTFDYSDTWQLIINTGTTIVTFLMVFLIQNTQNRDSKALQLKLDELIRSSKSARDTFMDLENLSDEELATIDTEFRELHQKQSVTPALHKLHTKIEQEHRRRIDLRKAGQMFNNILTTPIGGSKKAKK